jgi:hypothetical protein
MATMDASGDNEMTHRKDNIGQAPEPREVLTFPNLVYREMLAIILACAVLCLWSLAVDAPLKAIADPNWTENPAKAPWYFVGLQEVLVYFDPWIAGVGIPLLIIVGLVAIPYLDPNPAGVGRYNFKDRKFSVSLFMIGYVLWFGLILFGEFFRGPNWQFYWPWEDWSVHKEADHELISFSPVWGYITLAVYFIGGLGLPALLKPSFFKSLGWKRHTVTWLLVLMMFAVIFKMILRIFFNVKYILATPYFSI